MTFKQYRRKQIAELRPVTADEVNYGLDPRVSISKTDLEAGSPYMGDMVARNPKDHDDQWLVAEKYFKEHFEEI